MVLCIHQKLTFHTLGLRQNSPVHIKCANSCVLRWSIHRGSVPKLSPSLLTLDLNPYVQCRKLMLQDRWAFYLCWYSVSLEWACHSSLQNKVWQIVVWHKHSHGESFQDWYLSIGYFRLLFLYACSQWFGETQLRYRKAFANCSASCRTVRRLHSAPRSLRCMCEL